MELLQPSNLAAPNVPVPSQPLPPLPMTPPPSLPPLPPSTPPIAPRKSLLKPILIVVILLLLALGATTVLAWKTDYLDNYLPSSVKELLGKSPETSEQIPTGEEQSGQKTTEEVLSGLKQDFIEGGFEVAGPEEGSMWWAEEGARFILDRFASVLSVDIELTEEEIDKYNARSFEHPKAQDLHELSEKYFISNGYTKNLNNALAPQEDTEWLDYVVAFEKENIKCTVTTYNGTLILDYGTANEREVIASEIACEDDFSKARTEQLLYLNGLGFGEEQNTTGITIEKGSGDFFYIGVVGRSSVSGYGVIGKWEGDELIKIYEGQDVPPCVTVQEYNVPREVYGECY